MARKEARIRAAHIARQAWSRRLAVLLMCASVALLGTTLLHRGAEHADRRPGAAASSELRQLAALLQPLRACVAPAQRLASLERIRSRLETLEGALAVVLAQPAHPLFADVASAAADLKLVELEPALRAALSIARGDSLAVAWMCVDRLQPIEESELAAMLDSSDHALTIAGLRIAKSRDPMPTSLVAPTLACVRSSDARVRMLAIACLPAELDPSHTDAVLDLCDENPTDSGIAALLGRVPPSERGLESLLMRIQAADAQTVGRLQPAIRRYAETESVRKILWELASNLEDVSRASRALHCLEIVGAREPAPAAATTWPPRLQYGLARIRIANRELAGIDALLALASGGEENSVNDADTASEARIALAALARLAPHATIEDLRSWRRSIVVVPDEPLPAPAR